MTVRFETENVKFTRSGVSMHANATYCRHKHRSEAADCCSILCTYPGTRTVKAAIIEKTPLDLYRANIPKTGMQNI